MHWQFVTGYMTNCGSMSLDSVVSMLNMMLSDDPVTEIDTKVPLLTCARVCCQVIFSCTHNLQFLINALFLLELFINLYFIIGCAFLDEYLILFLFVCSVLTHYILRAYSASTLFSSNMYDPF